MSVKNTKLGGTDWVSPARIKPTDLNDTLDVAADRIRANQKLGNGFEQEQISPTTTSSSVTYSATMTQHLIKNNGTVTCYVNFDETATTDDFDIAPGETEYFEGEADAIHSITTSGTGDLRIIGQN